MYRTGTHVHYCTVPCMVHIGTASMRVHITHVGYQIPIPVEPYVIIQYIWFGYSYPYPLKVRYIWVSKFEFGIRILSQVLKLHFHFEIRHLNSIILKIFFSHEKNKSFLAHHVTYKWTNGTKPKTILYIFFYNMRQNPDPHSFFLNSGSGSI